MFQCMSGIFCVEFQKYPSLKTESCHDATFLSLVTYEAVFMKLSSGAISDDKVGIMTTRAL